MRIILLIALLLISRINAQSTSESPPEDDKSKEKEDEGIEAGDGDRPVVRYKWTISQTENFIDILIIKIRNHPGTIYF